MCGISGEYRFDGEHCDPGIQASMNLAQAKRGPDADGLFMQNHVALGHRRLMVMDMSEASQQPVTDAALGLTLVFNGAIYNYRELRRELEVKGYRFYSDGDTEVVLKAFHAWGAKCMQRFNGMFAFAIWQHKKNELFVARDRLGIKPLYYSANSRFFRFASFLPALLNTPDINKELSAEALHHYLHFHAVVPAPLTIVKDINKLEPGHYLHVKAGGEIHKCRWWDLQYPSHEDQSLSLEETQEQLLFQLRQAVKRRNVAAVDVGVLLSGGVDSSLLVGLLHEIKTDPIKTFSIGFNGAAGEAGDEFQYSDIIAKRFATDHRKIRVGSEEILKALPDTIGAMAEPMVSHDCVAFYLLSQQVAQRCRAVQSGQGADEVFAGYHWYPPMMHGADPVAAYRQHFFDRDRDEYLACVSEQWRTDDHSLRFVQEHFDTPGASHPVDRALRLDTRVMLTEDPVKRVDNMTMAASLEARVPFLDHELVEFAARIRPEHKLANGGKGILKDVARQIIPAEVIDRPKGYFPVPELKYLRGNVLEMVSDTLFNQRSQQRGLFQTDYIDRLVTNPEAHITPLNGSKLWQLGTLELWLQGHGL